LGFDFWDVFVSSSILKVETRCVYKKVSCYYGKYG